MPDESRSLYSGVAVKPRIVACRDSVDWAAMASAEINSAIQETTITHGVCSLMLTAGYTASLLYSLWEKSSLPQRLDINYYFGDERCVPPQHVDSNFGSVTRILWPRGIPDGILIRRMRAECANVEIAACEYEDLLPNLVDVLLLGMGPDGHIASLFPGHAALHESERSVAPIVGPKAPSARMTVTPKVIRQAKKVFLLVMGAEKGRVLAEALKTPADVDSLPVRLAVNGTWLLDKAALSQLGTAEMQGATWC